MNGTGGSYYACAPLATYNAQTAMAACQSHVAAVRMGECFAPSCGTTALTICARNTGAPTCGPCWIYAGGTQGSIYISPSTFDCCMMSSTSMRWN